MTGGVLPRSGWGKAIQRQTDVYQNSLYPAEKAFIIVRQNEMAQLHTPAEASEILNIRESWLRHKAAARAIPCTFVGKHLRFSDDDIAQIVAQGARQPVIRSRGTRR
jgi:excisionase family DNA binding protein